MTKSSERLWLVGILVVATVLRGGWLIVNHHNEGNYWGHSLNAADMAMQLVWHGEIGQFDPRLSEKYHGMAKQENRLIDPEELDAIDSQPRKLVHNYEDEIGLALIMGLVWKFVGQMRFIYVQILQVCLDLVCCALFYFSGKKLFRNPSLGLACAASYALNPLQIYLVSFPTPYPWMVFLSVVLIFILVQYFADRMMSFGRQMLAAIMLGLAIGLTTWIRSGAALVIIPVAIAIVMLARGRNAWALVLAMCVIEVAVVSPLLVRNYMLFGEPRVTRGVFWHTMWGGLGAHENPFGVVMEDNRVAEMVLSEHPGITKYGPEYEAVLRGWYVRALQSHPGWFVRAMGERLWWLVWPIMPKMASFYTAPLWALALWGCRTAVGKYRIGWQKLIALGLPSFYFFLVVIAVTAPNYKYVAPGYTYLIMLAGIALFALHERFQGRCHYEDSL